MTSDPIRLGVIGLGRAFVLMLETFRADNRIKLVAAYDPRPEAGDAFEAEFGGRAYRSAEELCADPNVETVYIASPHQFHCAHAISVARAGKHALVEKPMAITIDDALHMIVAFERAGRQLIVGPCHSFDAPVLKARDIIDEGEVGQPRMLHGLNCTDFLYRPRRREELRTADGGGVVFSQGVHQIDMARLLCGRSATAVTAATGIWDPERPTEGAYSVLLTFDDGAFASLTYSGYGRFDTDWWQDGIGELGRAKDPDDYGRARKALADVSDATTEAELKAMRTFGRPGGSGGPPETHEHFGPMIVFCEHAELRITPGGVHIYRDAEQEFVSCPFRHPRADVMDGLWSAVRENRPPPQTGEWGLATLEICHAILESARFGSSINLKHQIGLTS